MQENIAKEYVAMWNISIVVFFHTAGSEISLFDQLFNEIIFVWPREVIRYCHLWITDSKVGLGVLSVIIVK